ncbi:hypothetical protein [Subtercola lobariae]|uniref:Uncharacterized protein n=1 Tax=Subtercola lobariae TaxID=1588641 RepID=A0A917B5T3_9MICO|nr:hypothetical protein [Subtercola lobariae]GGF20860.1 hypothetical protein GCM10011399_13120 [Subtercola lobariae]
MPTTLPRYTLTETPQLTLALDDANVTWPEFGNDRAALLRKLVEAGWEIVRVTQADMIEARRRAVHDGAGAATGAFPHNVAVDLTNEWPE